MGNRNTQRRISRALVAGLGVIASIVVVVYLINVSRPAGTGRGGGQARGGAASTQPAVADPLAPKSLDAAAAAALSGVATLTTPTAPVAKADVSIAAPTASPQAGPKLDLLAATTTPPAGAAPQAKGNAPQANGTAPQATANPPQAGAGGPQLASNVQNAGPAAAAPAGGASGAAVVSAAPLADARAKSDAGKLLDARAILNDALVSGSLAEADARAAKKMLDEINQKVVFSPQRFPDDPFGGTFTVPPGGALAKIAASHEVTPELLQRINGMTDPRRQLQAGRAIKVLKGPFNAVVDKSDFSMEIWVGEPAAGGSLYVTTLPVGLGRDDSTPTGTWMVEPGKKLKNPTYYSPRGEGIIAADDPKNPLGEFWIGLTGTDGHAVGKQSYGIHGTIEPDSIGKQASMGCIRLVNENVAIVYELLVAGKSTVTVRE